MFVGPGTTVRWVLDRGVHTTTACHPANGDLPRRIPDRARPRSIRRVSLPGDTLQGSREGKATNPGRAEGTPGREEWLRTRTPG